MGLQPGFVSLPLCVWPTVQPPTALSSLLCKLPLAGSLSLPLLAHLSRCGSLMGSWGPVTA